MSCTFSTTRWAERSAPEKPTPAPGPEAIVGKLPRVPHEPGSLGERPGWDAAVDGAGPAKLRTLDQDDLDP